MAKSIELSPLISVVMTVYNGEKYLRAAIESILDQTFKDFEFIIVDDGSTDRSLAIIKSYKDARIRVISHKNMGVSASCNKAMKIARGVYIARQDADDISLPDRFQKQVDYLRRHSEVGLLGTNYYQIDGSDKIISATNVFTHPDDLRLAEIFYNQFGQGAVIIKTSVLKTVGGYDSRYKIAHDYDLWVRINRVSKIAILKESLYKWRSVGEGLSTSRGNQKRMQGEVWEIRNREFDYFRNNQSRFNFFRLHPLSTRGGIIKYFRKKNTLFRDMALMYCYHGLRRRAIPLMLLAILHAPWIGKTYSQLLIIIFQKDKIPTIKYEHLSD